MLQIDLNCDMGESFGSWSMGNDPDIISHVSSVNIACGFHAGDPSTMKRTVELAAKAGVAVGAHPSYRDLEGFGRRDMSVSTNEIYDLVIYQIGALEAICRSAGVRLKHVKPHGALYNRSARDFEAAKAIARAVFAFDPKLILFGLSGSESIRAGGEIGLRTANEVFADRTYTDAGQLTPRTEPDALITSVEQATQQITTMIEKGYVVSQNGNEVDLKAETVCIHGDGESAVSFAREIRKSLKARNVEVSSL